MKLNKILYAFAIAGLTIATLGSCKNKSDIATVVDGKLTVITSADYAPYEFVDNTKSGQEMFVGSDISMAKYLAEQMGLKLEIKSMAFNSCLAAIDSNKGDVFIAGLTYDESRAAQYLYSDAYFNNGDGDQILVMSKENASKYTTIESMNNKDCKIAVQAASVQANLVKENLPNADISEISDLNQAIDLLVSGTYTAVAMASTPAEQVVAAKTSLAMSNFKFEIDESQMFLYMCVKKGNTELMEVLNGHIAKIQEEKLYSGWIEAAIQLKNELGDNAGEFAPDPEKSSN